MAINHDGGLPPLVRFSVGGGRDTHRGGRPGETGESISALRQVLHAEVQLVYALPDLGLDIFT